MNYLLDTCILIYLVTDIDKLNDEVRGILINDKSNLYISTESLKELIIKIRKHPNQFSNKKYQDFINLIKDLKINILVWDSKVLDKYVSLNINTAMNHKDPSDHIIICSTIVNNYKLISSDLKFEFYKNQGLKLIKN